VGLWVLKDLEEAPGAQMQNLWDELPTIPTAMKPVPQKVVDGSGGP
jgi:hypothetical protein